MGQYPHFQLLISFNFLKQLQKTRLRFSLLFENARARASVILCPSLIYQEVHDKYFNSITEHRFATVHTHASGLKIIFLNGSQRENRMKSLEKSQSLYFRKPKMARFCICQVICFILYSLENLLVLDMFIKKFQKS